MLPKNVVKRIMKAGDVSKSTDKAKSTLGDILWEITQMITERSVALAKHAKRKTIKKEDVILAKSEIWG
jgi:histone H3/H4